VADAQDGSHPRKGIHPAISNVINTKRGDKVADVQVETPKLEATTVERNGDRLFAIDRLNGRVIVVGVLNNYQEVDSDHYTAEVSITTGPSSINGIYAPSVRRYYVGVPQHGNTDDQILVYGIQ
jgi:hypothetical protein